MPKQYFDHHQFGRALIFAFSGLITVCLAKPDSASAATDANSPQTVTGAQTASSKKSLLDELQSLADNPIAGTGLNLALAESAVDSTQANSPAAFSFNHSSNSPQWLTADAAVQLAHNFYDASPTGNIGSATLSGFGEIHRDTQSTNLANSREFGTTFVWNFTNDQNAVPLLGQWATIAVNATYKDDFIKTGRSLLYSVGINPKITSGVPLTRTIYLEKGSLNIKPWLYFLGADNGAFGKAGKPGKAQRIEGSLGVVYYPFDSKTAADKSWQLNLAEKYWSNISRSGIYTQEHREESYFTAAATYFVNQNQNAGLSLSYTTGHDPLLGKAAYNLYALKFTLKFVRSGKGE